MGSLLRREIEKLKKKGSVQKWELRCPECGWESTVYGDVPLEMILLDFDINSLVQDTSGTATRELLNLFNHEHPYDDFIEKRTGLPLGDPRVSGFGEVSTLQDDG